MKVFVGNLLSNPLQTMNIPSIRNLRFAKGHRNGFPYLSILWKGLGKWKISKHILLQCDFHPFYLSGSKWWITFNPAQQRAHLENWFIWAKSSFGSKQERFCSSRFFMFKLFYSLSRKYCCRHVETNWKDKVVSILQIFIIISITTPNAATVLAHSLAFTSVYALFNKEVACFISRLK